MPVIELPVPIRWSALRTFSALIFVASCVSVAHAQSGIVRYSNGSARIDYSLLGNDVLVDAQTSFGITLTVSAGAEISSNPYDDGYQSLEIFNNNYLDMTGGVLEAEGGRPGGATLHNVSSAGISGGTMDYLAAKDSGIAVIYGGTVGRLETRDGSYGILYGGSLSSSLAYNSSSIFFSGGTLGQEGIFSFDNSSLRFEGENIFVFGGVPATVQGRTGTMYSLRVRWANNQVEAAQLFREGGPESGVIPNIIFRDQSLHDHPVIAVILPDAPAGSLVTFAISLCAAASFHGRRATRRRKTGE